MKKSVIILSFILLSLIALVSLGVAIYSYSQVQSVKKNAVSAPDSDQKMLTTIASLIVLPEEKPTIINITDRDKLQDQEFFRKAQNGDKVVIYESIRRIFLFRPSLNKIIDIAPLVFNQQQQAQYATQSANLAPTITKDQLGETSGSARPVGVEERGNFRL